MDANRASLLHDWRRCLRRRAQHPVLRHGRLRRLRLPAPLLGFVREDAQERIVCVFNFSAEAQRVTGLRYSGLPDTLAPYGTAFAVSAMENFAAMALAAD
jgi:glycosidase